MTDHHAARVTDDVTRPPILDDPDDPRFEVRIAAGSVVALHQLDTGFGSARWAVVLADDAGTYRSTLATGRGQHPPVPVLDQALRTADRLYGLTAADHDGAPGHP